MKKRVLSLTLAVLIILTALAALVSCAGDDTPDVDFYVELIGSSYDSSTDTTHVNLKVRVDNYTEGRDVSAYKFKLSFYSSYGRLLNTEECERSGIRIAEGSYERIEWNDYGTSDGFYVTGDVANVTVTPISVSFHSDTVSSGSDDGSDDDGYGAKDDVSDSASVWGWITFALGVICVVIAVVLICNGFSEDEEGYMMGAAGLSIGTLILFIISGALLGGFAGIGIFWLFLVISWIVWLFTLIFAFVLADGFECGYAGIASFAALASAATVAALTVLGAVWLFWVLFAASIVLGFISMVGLGEL